MLTQVADGVWVRQSEWVWTNTIAVRGEDGLILVDPGIDGSELNQLADDLDRLDIPVVAGFSTHPHWDHLLWHSRFGDVPRYATAAGAHAASEARERAQAMAAESASGIPLELIGLVTPLPADGGPVPGEIVEHQAHAIGHAAILLADRRVPLAGDMLSDVLIPLLDPRRPDQVGAYETALNRLGEVVRHVDVVIPGHGGVAEGSRGGGPPRRRSCLHRRAAARRGTGRRASGAGCGLALGPPQVEPGAGPRTVGLLAADLSVLRAQPGFVPPTSDSSSHFQKQSTLPKPASRSQLS
jgi:glyoxylase-like metal-dependent hydrolase (beta-lactamase superfamily II)